MIPALSPYTVDQPLLTPYNPKANQTVRNITLFFAGRLCGGHREVNCTEWPDLANASLRYSAGVRAKVSCSAILRAGQQCLLYLHSASQGYCPMHASISPARV